MHQCNQAQIERLLHIFRAAIPKDPPLSAMMDYVASANHGWEEHPEAGVGKNYKCYSIIVLVIVQSSHSNQ